MGEDGVVVLETLSTLSVACLTKLRGELEAADAYGVLKTSEKFPGNNCRAGIVRDAVVQDKYQGSALWDINKLLRGLAREIIRKVPLSPGDPKLWLGVPDELYLLAFDRG